MASFMKRGKSILTQVAFTKNGKTYRLSKSFSNKQDAQIWAHTLEIKKAGGVDLVDRQTPMMDYYDYWLEFAKKGELKETSYLSYRRIGQTFRKLFDDVRLCDVTDTYLQKMLDEYGQTHAQKTVSDMVRPLRAMLKYAYAHGLLLNDISSLVRAHGKVSEKRNVALSITDMRTLKQYCLDHAEEDEFCVLVLVALLTGLRRGECLGLRPDSLFEEPTDCGIHVREQRSPWVKRDKTLKTKNAYRTLSLPREVFELLKQVEPKSDGYIFETYGYRVALRLEPLLQAAKVGHTTFHGLRDTFASFLFSQGIDLAYVSRHLGHASLSITQDYYISLMPEKKHAQNGRAMDLLSKL
ncbi:tyrosine-type recombinase/integrase [Lacticaseibacillus kribbianus]|uniref:tyrosine-type recombinase/integrase n=1 Tax=Lacticaseibacillus kribbianus TaxID=2926292 RepID=UPI001CD3BDB8|nr:site-specific integrase [Lacticaseibacillus kribbianus]